jgi:hypothetical protein
MTTHLDDAQLIRFDHGAADGPEAALAERHVEECPTCRARLATFQRREARLATLLRATDPPVPHMRRRAPRILPRPALAAATVVLIVTGVAVTVQPVRAWLIDRSRDLWALVTGTATEPPSTLTGSADSSTASVSFAPSGDTFAIRVEAFQASGTLVLLAAPIDSVTAEVVGGASEHFVVLPSVIRIVNTDASTAHYRITVPERLSRVTIEIGGRRLAEIEPRIAAARWTVDLGSRPDR